MAIEVQDIYPIQILHPFTAAPLPARGLVLSKKPDGSPKVIRSITGDPDLDRVIGSAGEPGVTVVQELSLGVSGATWEMVDVPRLTQNFIATSVTLGNILVPAGATAYIPLTGGNSSEDLSVLNDVIMFGAPSDGLYFGNGVISVTASVGTTIAFLEMVQGSDLNRPGEIINEIPFAIYKNVQQVGAPESIAISASMRVQSANREIALRLSHDNAGAVTFTTLSGSSMRACQQPS